MRHTRSDEEWKIRDTLVPWIKQNISGARIIHELVADGCRADVAAVQSERLFLFEIKSRKDVLKNLDHQMKAFEAVSHGAFAVVHEKHFFTEIGINGPYLRWPHGYNYPVWCFPEGKARHNRWEMGERRFYSLRQPHARRFLTLLWNDELYCLGVSHGVAVKAKMNAMTMIDLLSYELTGKQISRGVCRMLRLRNFAEAEPPMSAEEA